MVDKELKLALLPKSQQARAVFGRLQQNAQAIGRRGPQRCKTLEQQEKLEAACAELERRGVFQAALDATLENGMTDLRGVVNALAWKAKNGWRPGRGQRAAGTSEERRARYASQPEVVT